MTLHKLLLLLLFGTMVAAQPHFTPVDSTGVPYIIIITNVNVASDDLTSGAEIAVFDDSLCVGVGEFDGNYNYQFSAWEANQSQELAGFTNGAVMQFRVWTLYDGSWQEFETDAVYAEGDGSFGNGLYAVLSLEISIVGIGSGFPVIEPESFGLGAYPNPFNSEIRIPVELNEQSTAELTIISLQGREVWSRSIQGSDQLNWQGVDQQGIKLPSGIYLVTLRGDSRQITERITLLK